MLGNTISMTPETKRSPRRSSSTNQVDTMPHYLHPPFIAALLVCPAMSSCWLSGGSSSAPVGSGGTGTSSTTTFTVSASVSGLDTGKQIVLLDNGTDSITITSNQSVAFATALASGSAYAVTVATQPAGETCAVAGGSGTIASADVSATVSCHDNAPAASVNAWTWMAGSNTGGSAGSYGTQGVPSTTNAPSARQAMGAWTDAAGNLWLMGGFGTAAIFNDLWMYAPKAGTWTWVSGSNTGNAPGVYGTQGVAAAGNTPGARSNGMMATDAAGNFWLFGGVGYDINGRQGYLNDVWRYSPTTGMWTWLGGSPTASPTAVFGTKGTPSVSNQPWGRASGSAWIDSAGNLWIFGGAADEHTPAPTPFYWVNDLWSFNPTSGAWTWVAGSGADNTPGVYGTKGLSASTNSPGARAGACMWVDASGMLWMYGGAGADGTGALGDLDDIWSFDPGSGMWTWENGSANVNVAPVYGTRGVAAATNDPGGRAAGPTCAKDDAGNFLVFGGSAQGLMSDLWSYNLQSGIWTWLGGPDTPNTPATYGALGVASPSNAPGGRYDSAAWIDASGGLWIFGGQGFDASGPVEENDLWRYQF